MSELHDFTIQFLGNLNTQWHAAATSPLPAGRRATDTESDSNDDYVDEFGGEVVSEWGDEGREGVHDGTMLEGPFTEQDLPLVHILKDIVPLSSLPSL